MGASIFGAGAPGDFIDFDELATAMRILFVNYGQIDSNSGNHIVSLAARLQKRGHNCTVAVPGNRQGEAAEAGAGAFGETVSVVPYPNLLRRSETKEAFDLIHLWTPREGVRKFSESFLEKSAVPWFLHFEDNEEAILERLTGKTVEALRALPRRRLEKALRDGVIHPEKYHSLVTGAAGVTVIYRSISSLIPEGVPCREMLPVIDLKGFSPGPRDPDRRKQWGVGEQEKVVCYNGNDHAVNREDMVTLYTALHLLNRDHFPVRLVRTGIVDRDTLAGLPFNAREFMIDLGFVARPELPGIIAEADLAIQPGVADEFNQFRLPSKIPEYLAMGKVVVLPEANIADRLKDGEEALFLKTGTPEEVVGACLSIWGDTGLRARIEAGARSFAEKWFEGSRTVSALEAFYEERLRGAKEAPGGAAAKRTPWWRRRN